MTSEQLISRLARELYDLKQKLEDIRGNADRIYQETAGKHELIVIRHEAIDITNLIDSGEVYED